MPGQLVVVDDDEIDRYLVRRTVRRWNPTVEVSEIGDGKTALSQVFNAERLASAERPIVVLLDINMPQHNGFELLEEASAQLADETLWDRLIVFMLTSSDHPADKNRAAATRFVEGFIVKPLGPEHLDLIARSCALRRSGSTPN